MEDLLMARLARSRGETYVGPPCRKCGGTARYRSCCNCIACAKMASHRQRRDPLFAWLRAPVLYGP